VGQFIIEASNIRKKYDDKTVLKDISLQAQRGEAVGLVGGFWPASAIHPQEK